MGELSLRKQRMTLPMLEALRTETVRIQLVMAPLDEDMSKDIRRVGFKYTSPVNEFIILRTTVTNLSCRFPYLTYSTRSLSRLRFTAKTLVLALNLAVDPIEQILFDGALSDIRVGELGAGASRDIDMAVCFTSLGTFEVGAEVRTVDIDSQPGQTQVGAGTLRVVVDG
jgi:trafficking protein particle complex subunit 9